MFGSVLFSRESGPQGHRAGISAFQQGVWPRGHRAGAGGVFGCLGRERRRWCEWRPEVLLSILQVPRTAPTKGDQSIKVEKPQLWSGQ